MSAGTQPIRVIAGPTAVGKTAYSLQLANEAEAEIISADSRQIYRQLTIGTAKPNREELARVRHHFINELDVGEPFSAGQFASQANDRIADILARSHKPIVVGGATLYLHALVHGLSSVAASDVATRANLEAELAAYGPEKLYHMLVQVDPRTASKMDKTKTSRVMRALEVYRLTGIPLSEYHATVHPPAYEFDVTVLTMNRPRLYDRINSRVDRMLDAGLINEVRSLVDSGINSQTPVLQTIGYQEVAAHLRGETAHEEMIRLIKRNSRRYAKRQLTWFRRYPKYRWVDVTEHWQSAALAEPRTAPS